MLRVLDSSRWLWVSKWILLSSNISSLVDLKRVVQVVQVRSLAAIRRLLFGESIIHMSRELQMLMKVCRMGELEPWIDENFVRSVWFGMGYQVNVKMIRDKFSGYVNVLVSVIIKSLTYC